jgi:hypothetical protein
MIIYGFKRTTIGFQEQSIKCPSCEKESMADLMITARYLHIFWIPFFPLGKRLDIICKECGLRKQDLYLDTKLIINGNEIKKSFRYPFFTYIGFIILLLFIISVIVSKK